MSENEPTSTAAPSTEQTLRRLFLTLFLRGRSAAQLQGKALPTSVGRKLAVTLAFYFLIGLTAAFMAGRSPFELAIYLHSMTFVFLGMFVASSAGEVLFNKDEAEILLHRPIEPSALLRAKVRVLVEVCLWLALAFNAVGMLVGTFSHGGNLLFLPALLVSLVLEALFCTGCVVLVYQLCLRWFGRERLEGMMTMAQVLVTIAAVLSGQILPQAMARLPALSGTVQTAWWLVFFPPAWFAAMVDAVAGGRALGSWLLSLLAVSATLLVAWLAFGKLAHGYHLGLQRLHESKARPQAKGRGRGLLDRLVHAPPLVWWLRDPVTRTSFLLTTAYLVRDRDVKLRVYPGLAPVMVMPLLMLAPRMGFASADGGFGLAFVGVYLGLVPLMALEMLQYSQQWQAADVFRVAPLRGPARLCRGARRAVLCWLTAPAVLAVAVISMFVTGGTAQLPLLLPGVIAMPVYALIPTAGGKGAPLSRPTDESKSTSRGLSVLGVMAVSVGLAAAAAVAWQAGYFVWLILAEAVAAGAVFAALSAWEARGRW